MTDQKTMYPGQGEHEDESRYDHMHARAPMHGRLTDNIPALIGFIILAVIVIWGLTHALSLATPWLSSLIPASSHTAPKSQTLPSPTLTGGIVTHAAPSDHASSYAAAAPADLYVHILDIGVIDSATGVFVNRPPYSPGDLVAVRFDISNEGGSPTGPWYFSAYLPSGPGGYQYNSPLQDSLGAGDHVVNTLRFSPVVSGGGLFSVIVDSEGMVNESNETNNTASIFIPMPVYY